MADVATVSVGIDLNIAKATQDLKAFTSKKYRFGFDNQFSGPLRSINGDIQSFDTSLTKATNRVVAFGAAAAIFKGSQAAFSAFAKATIEVEDSLARINVNLGESSSGLKKFSGDLFNVARQTGSSFETASKAAEEFARQGLGAEETIKRTKDALILSRIAAMDSMEAVNDLTAAVNSYAKEALSTTDIINKFVALDTRFAVSSKDLADGLQRAGAVAADAGLSLDKFLAMVTAVKQTTGRDGAVIGNAFKTIFERTKSKATLDQFEELGIATKDLAGDLLPVDRILQNLAGTYDTLSKAQQQQVSKSVANIQQINIFKALLNDLSKAYGVTSQAAQVSGNATDEALEKNIKLNLTLKSQLENTKTTFTQLFATLGNQDISGIFKTLLGSVENIRKFFSEDKGTDFGKSLGKGLLKGISNVISGPGILIMAKILGTAFRKVIQTIGTDISGLLGANSVAAKRADAQQRINDLLRQGTEAEIAQFRAGTSVLQQKRAILAIQERITAMSSSSPLANSFLKVSGFGSTKIESALGGKTRIPNFADLKIRSSEIPKHIMGGHDIQSATYISKSAGGPVKIRAMQHSTQVRHDLKVGASPGEGYRSFTDRQIQQKHLTVRGIFGDSKEPTIKNIPFDRFTEIKAKGNTYKIIPNFASATGFLKGAYPIGRGGFGTVFANRKTPSTVFKQFNELFGDDAIKQEFEISKHLASAGVPVARVKGSLKGALKMGGIFKERINGFEGSQLSDIGMDSGEIRRQLESKVKGVGVTPVDLRDVNFMIKGHPDQYSDIMKKSGYKAAHEKALSNSVIVDPGQFYKSTNLYGPRNGIPHFADPITEAIGREMAAGVPKHLIYLDKDRRLVSPENPQGLLVANHRDEPIGGHQGVSRVIAEGRDPKKAGELKIPHFAELPSQKDIVLRRLGITKDKPSGQAPSSIDVAMAGQKAFIEEEKKSVAQLKIANNALELFKKNTELAASAAARQADITNKVRDSLTRGIINKVNVGGGPLLPPQKAQQNEYQFYSGRGKNVYTGESIGQYTQGSLRGGNMRGGRGGGNISEENKTGSFSRYIGPEIIKEEREKAIRADATRQKARRLAEQSVRPEHQVPSMGDSLIENAVRYDTALPGIQAREARLKREAQNRALRDSAIQQKRQERQSSITDQNARLEDLQPRLRESQVRSEREKMLSEKRRTLLIGGEHFDKNGPSIFGGRKSDIKALSRIGVDVKSEEGQSLLHDRGLQRTNKRANVALGAAFVAPLAAGFIPEGKGGTRSGQGLGAASGALQGAGYGGIFGPVGAGVGAAVGAIGGAFLKATKSLEEFITEIDDSTAAQSKNVDAIQQVFNLSNQIKDAKEDNASPQVIGRLQTQQLKALQSNPDTKVRERLAAAGGDTDEIKKILEEQQDTLQKINASGDLAKQAKTNNDGGILSKAGGLINYAAGGGLGSKGKGILDVGTFGLSATLRKSGSDIKAFGDERSFGESLKSQKSLAAAIIPTLTAANIKNIDIKSLNRGNGSEEDIKKLKEAFSSLGAEVDVTTDNYREQVTALSEMITSFKRVKKSSDEVVKANGLVGFSRGAFANQANLDTIRTAAVTGRNPMATNAQKAESRFNFYNEIKSSGLVNEAGLETNQGFKKARAETQRNRYLEIGESYLTGQNPSIRGLRDVKGNINPGAIESGLKRYSQSGIQTADIAKYILSFFEKATNTVKNAGVRDLRQTPIQYQNKERVNSLGKKEINSVGISGLVSGIGYSITAGAGKGNGSEFVTSKSIEMSKAMRGANGVNFNKIIRNGREIDIDTALFNQRKNEGNQFTLRGRNTSKTDAASQAYIYGEIYNKSKESKKEPKSAIDTAREIASILDNKAIKLQISIDGAVKGINSEEFNKKLEDLVVALVNVQNNVKQLDNKVNANGGTPNPPSAIISVPRKQSSNRAY